MQTVAVTAGEAAAGGHLYKAVRLPCALDDRGNSP